MTGKEQPFFNGAAYGRTVRMRTAEVASPCIVVGIELDQRHGTKLLLDRAQDGEKDGMVPAHAECTRVVAENIAQLCGNATKCVLEREWIDGKIAIVGDAPPGKWIEIENGIPRANHGALRSYIARAEACSGTVRGAIVERNSNQRDIKFLRARNMRQAHEC